jgi:hypothetical protein
MAKRKAKDRGADRYVRANRLPDEVVYTVCELFFQKRGATEISELVNEQFKSNGIDLTREAVYPIVMAGHDRGFFELYSPLAHPLQTQLGDTFNVKPPYISEVPAIQVVSVEGDRAQREVPLHAAKAALNLIRAISKRKGEGKEVHIGFASGMAMRELARLLAECIRRDPKGVPPLCLHAVCSGFSVNKPETACITFFSFFDNLPIRVRFVGLFTQPYVIAKEYHAVKQMPGAREAFAQRDDIDLVITALARAGDKHSELRNFIDILTKDDGDQSARVASPARAARDAVDDATLMPEALAFLRTLAQRGHAGDVQYRPFSKNGPIEVSDKRQLVPFTLFGIEKLVWRAANKKTLLLVAPPCFGCGIPRTEALLPLMQNPALKVWTHVVMDAATATEVYNLARGIDPEKTTAANGSTAVQPNPSRARP